MLLIWRDKHVLPEAYENILVHCSSCFHFHSNFAQIRRVFMFPVTVYLSVKF